MQQMNIKILMIYLAFVCKTLSKVQTSSLQQIWVTNLFSLLYGFDKEESFE